MAFFPSELEHLILRFVCKHKGPWIAKTILRKRNRAGGIKLPDFCRYHKHTGSYSLYQVQFGKVKLLSCVRLFVTSWTIAYQAPPSMEFSSQRVLGWVAISFSRGSSQPGDWTRVSCTAGRRFTLWATREAPLSNCRWGHASRRQSTALYCLVRLSG